jgi:hypothetical protein
VPAVTTSTLPLRSLYERIPDRRLTINFVPVTNMMGEKATCFCRSTLLVVDPHSRSILPDSSAGIRVSGVTATKSMRICGLSISRPISSTIALHRSIE